MAQTSPEISFFDPDTNDCPLDAYRALRDEAPVWLDPATGWYVVTRYEDVRSIVLDPKRFTNGVVAARANQAVTTDDPELIEKARAAANESVQKATGGIQVPGLPF